MTSNNRTQAGTRLNQMIASGGTNLSSGLFRAISILSTADAEASCRLELPELLE